MALRRRTIIERIEFDGQVVIVTGGGRGIGRAHCLDLGRRGARIVVADFSRDHADAVVREVEAAGGTAVACYADVATKVGGEEIVQAAVDSFGTVDAVINNAGNVRSGYFEDLTEEQIDSVFGVHLHGAFFVTQPAWRVMKERGYGRVVMTCSSTGLFSHQGAANYAAAKGGIYGLTKALAYEGRRHGIVVNAVLPGAATTITDDDPVPGFDVDWGGSTPDGGALEGGRSWLPIFETLEPRRTAHAVAPLVTFLASRACTVSGEAFVAMAGWYGRVFVGKARGYIAPDTEAVVAEDIAEHWDDVRDLSEYTVPEDTWEDLNAIAEAVKAAQATWARPIG